jgi:hypothetical protein
MLVLVLGERKVVGGGRMSGSVLYFRLAAGTTNCMGCSPGSYSDSTGVQVLHYNRPLMVVLCR